MIHDDQSNTQPTRIALIGCGAVAQQFYVPALAFLEKTGLLSVGHCVDPDQRAREGIKERLPGAMPAQDIGAIDPAKIDLAIIASPPKFHGSQVHACFENGWHVLCEKPMAHSIEEAESMVEASRKSRRLLAVGHYKRFFPTADEIKRIVESRIFGELTSFSIQEGGKFSWPAASDSFFREDITPGGVLLDIGVHVLDLLLHWLGEPTSIVYADDSLGGLEANAKLDLTYASGTRGSVFLTRDWQTCMSYTFKFEKATVVYSVNNANGLSIRLADSPNYLSGTLKSFISYGSQELPSGNRETNAQAFIRQLENVVRAVRGADRLRVDGDQGLAALKFIHRCYEERTPIHQPWLTPDEQAAALKISQSHHANRV